jgi:hypothetical protein
MAVVVDDLPPLIFHAELGKKQATGSGTTATWASRSHRPR